MHSLGIIRICSQFINSVMASNLLGVCLLFSFVVLVQVSADGVCNRTELTGETKLVRKWNYVNGRRKTYMDYEPVKKIVLKCCDGYLIDLSRTTGGPPGKLTPPVCNPQCEPACTHGTCVKPNICNCVPGYEFKNSTCQPVCSAPCHNGTCVEPETCKCLAGYSKTDVNVCTPTCSKGCGNGSCISPEICQCNDGYTLTNGICEPTCWPPCETGECIAPDTCNCGPGYERIMSNVTACEPICSPACENGVCVGPNICMCDRGYEWHNGTCRPICSETCVNATCVAPDTCKCFEGHTELEKNVCNPKCTNGCGFGVCVRPEVCECNEGFSLLNETCKPVCDPPCENGVCTVSFNCHCNPGYYLEDRICEPESKRQKIYKENSTRKTVTHDEEHTVGSIWADTGRYNVGTTEPEKYKTVNYLPVEDERKSQESWMYYVIPVLVLLLIFLILILIWKRHSIGDFFVGRSYIISEDQKHTNVNNIPDVTFSAVQERQAKREGKTS